MKTVMNQNTLLEFFYYDEELKVLRYKEDTKNGPTLIKKDHILLQKSRPSICSFRGYTYRTDELLEMFHKGTSLTRETGTGSVGTPKKKSTPVSIDTYTDFLSMNLRG